jgi:hypothetical protein
MPSEGNIKEIADFISPQGVHRKVLKTIEVDAYIPQAPIRKNTLSCNLHKPQFHRTLANQP